jgi:MFS family permease
VGGPFVGGQVVAALLRHYDWPVIFILGGVFPLVLLIIMRLWLPESPRFLVARANLAPRDLILLARLGITPGRAEQHGADIALENPVKMLFGKGYALQTGLLWVIFDRAVHVPACRVGSRSVLVCRSPPSGRGLVSPISSEAGISRCRLMARRIRWRV